MTGPDAPRVAVVALVITAAALWLMAGLIIPTDRVTCPNIDAGRAPLAQDGREGVWRGH